MMFFFDLAVNKNEFLIFRSNRLLSFAPSSNMKKQTVLQKKQIIRSKNRTYKFLLAVRSII